MERLRNLPLWLRIFLAILPFLLCIPLACIAFFGYQQYAGAQAATVAAAAQETEQARAATEQFEATVAAAEAATADFAAQEAEAAASATAQALFLEQQALTQTALVPPTFTATLAPTEILPTATLPRPVVAGTPTPNTVTVTLRECRGFEGTVIFGNAPAQSLHGFASISFTVPPGTYNLRIDWLGHSSDNINQPFTFTASQTLTFGEQCR